MAQVQAPPQNAIPGANGAGGANQFVTTSLYVGDLEQNVTAAPCVKPIGIMIVTRLKAQADEVV